ncbi:DUF2971 domain-containing protein, partial [Chromobacterium piscinae]
IDKIFQSEDLISLKCSLPKDFNDPYELFLTIDFNKRPDVLAFYSDAIGKIPQVPTTCFSLSPSVIPMWAHYAQNLEGFTIAFDEEKLIAHFPESGFGDVDYLDKPDGKVESLLYQAFTRGKPRHMHFFQTAVFSAAYYTKATCWSYEEERRMVISHEETTQVNEMILINIPNDCATALICGPRATEETKKALKDKAAHIGCDYLEMKIGKSSATPFFINSSNIPYVSEKSELRRATVYCKTCHEPLSTESELCSWCQITKTHKMHAAARNPYRLLENYGLLDSYIQSVLEIDKRIARK